MSTATAVNPRAIRAKTIRKGLSRDELRELARPGEVTTEYGSPVYTTRVKSRSAKNTYVVSDGVTVGRMQQPIEPARALDVVRQVQEAIAGMEMLQVDRRVGENPAATLRCRLFVPKDYARIAFMWHNMLFDSDSSQEPDFVSVYVPDWPERLIFCDVLQGYTYILGSDYPGELQALTAKETRRALESSGATLGGFSDFA